MRNSQVDKERRAFGAWDRMFRAFCRAQIFSEAAKARRIANEMDAIKRKYRRLNLPASTEFEVNQ